MQAAPSATIGAPDRRSWQHALVLLFATAAWTMLWFVHTLGYWEDDAYIHLEFARSIARGHGFSFNGAVVYGDTSPLWVWLLAGMHALVPNWMAAGKTLAFFGALFALSGAFAFARSLTRGLGRPRSHLFAAAMLLVLVVNPYFGYWAFSGMEALTAAGLVCWGLVAVAADPLSVPLAPGRFLLGCLCAGVAPLLRPEMGFFTLLLGLILFVRWVNMPLAFRGKLTLFFVGFLLVAGPGLSWGFYALHTFGSVLPNTNAAKRANPHDSVVRHLLQIYGLGFPLVLLGLAALAGFAGWFALDRQRGPQRSGRITPQAIGQALHLGGWLLFVWTAVNCLFYVANHTYVQTRYIFVTAPVLTIALLAIARKLWPRLYLAGTVFGVLFGITISLLATWPLIRNKTGVDRDYASLAAFLRTLPPNDPVAYYSIGEAAFLSEHPLIDVGGITRPGVIPFLFDPTWIRVLWWAHEQGARYMVLDHAPEPGSTLLWSHDIPTTGWFLNPHRYAASDHLMLWKLPASPTLPLPANMPTEDTP